MKSQSHVKLNLLSTHISYILICWAFHIVLLIVERLPDICKSIISVEELALSPFEMVYCVNECVWTMYSVW